MGLDMYLSRCNRTEHDIDELMQADADAKPDNPDVKEFLPLYNYDWSEAWYSIFHEVAYWRKFNALHAWFVANVQDGIDDCGKYEVVEDDLINLATTLMEMLITKDASLMPPARGFFFGSTEIDDYYWSYVTDAGYKISELLKEFDWDKHRMFYQSSW